MAKHNIGMPLPVFHRPASEPVITLHRQIHERIRGIIVSGRLAPGARLPSSRTLAADLRVSRSTVELAFTQLEAEGLLIRKVGAGSYVASAIPARERPPRKARVAPEPPPARVPMEALSDRGRLAVAAANRAEIWVRRTDGPFPAPVEPPNRRIFARGLPSLNSVPMRTWHRLMARRARLWHGEPLGQGNAAGYRPLREALVSYLATARGVSCDWRQILIVNSTQQAIDLAARLLLDPGDPAWLEEPGYLGAWAAFHSAGASIAFMPVDDEGVIVDEAMTPAARLAYVTPSHQFPLGATMSLSRRHALLKWAARTSAWVIEDDYDSEFRYSGRPLAALQGLQADGRVIYTGTFSKVLFPALRMAYVVLPQGLMDAFTAARTGVDGFSPAFMQAVMTDFITAGHLSAHIRRMRKLYHERRDILLDAITRRLAGRLQVKSADTGLYATGLLQPGTDDREISRRATLKGLDLPPLSRFYHTRRTIPGLLFSYANVSPADIRRGIDLLATVV